MSAIKRYLEEISEEMGLGGEITEEVMAEAQRRSEEMRAQKPPKKIAPSIHKQNVDERKKKSG